MPSIGGGTNRSATDRVADADVVDDGDVASVAEGDGVSMGDGVGDSCAKAIVVDSDSKEISVDAFVMTSGSRVITPIDLREKIVAPLAIGEEFFIDCTSCELVVQPGEAAQVI